VDVGGDRLAAEREQQRLHRPLPAVGERAEVRRHQPGALQPAPDSARDLGRAERSLERVGRDEDRALGDRHGRILTVTSATIGRATVHKRNDPSEETIEESLRSLANRPGFCALVP
jgi:hypothetical protein